MEFYVTTSADPEYLKVVEQNRLDTIYTDSASQIKDLQDGKLAQIVVDDHTTIKMYLYTVAKGL